MPSNRNESEQNARRLMESLFGNAPSVPPVSSPAPAPARRPRASRSRTVAVAAAVATAAAPAQAVPQRAATEAASLSGYVGETTGLESREVRAIELCARKMELLALKSAIDTELSDLDTQLQRLKRSA